MIPAAIQDRPRWALWKRLPGKNAKAQPRKVPFQLSGDPLDPTNAAHFTTCEKARAALDGGDFSGLGFGLFAEDDITVFDFDHLSDMPKKQRKAIKKLCRLTYSETSTSGDGVHCFFLGHDPRILAKRFLWSGIKVEVYRDQRYIAFTGDLVEGSPVNLQRYNKKAVQKCLGKLPAAAERSMVAVGDHEANDIIDAVGGISDRQLLVHLNADRFTDKSGAGTAIDWIENGYGDGADQSSSDFQLCATLWDRGASFSQIDRIVSEAHPRADEKWHDREDYRFTTLLRSHGVSLQNCFEVSSEHVKREQKTGHQWMLPERLQKPDPVDFNGKNKDLREKLRAAIADFNSSVAMLGGQAPHSRSADEIVDELEDLRKQCFKLAGKINDNDVERLNRFCGMVPVGGDIMVATRASGEMALMNPRGFNMLLRPENQAITLREVGSRKEGIPYRKLESTDVSSHDNWVAHEGRLVFPGSPQLLPSPLHVACEPTDLVEFNVSELSGKVPFNLFSGVAYLPNKPDGATCGPILEHIRDVWADRDEEVNEYLLNWLARMVQYPERMAETAIVLKSEEGVGKNIISNIFSRYYGRHSYTLTDLASLARFNAKPARSVFLVLNEATFGGNKTTTGAMKMLVTDPEINTEEKNERAIMVSNCVHMVIFSNNDWVVPVTLGDRRFLVLELPSGHLENKAVYFSRLHGCIKNGGDRAFINYLMLRDIKDFTPSNLPETRNTAKVEQARLGLSPLASWFLEALEDGGIPLEDGTRLDFLSEDGATKISNRDLKAAFRASSAYRTSRYGETDLRVHASKLLNRSLRIKTLMVRSVKNVDGSGYGRGMAFPPYEDMLRGCVFTSAKEID